MKYSSAKRTEKHLNNLKEYAIISYAVMQRKNTFFMPLKNVHNDKNQRKTGEDILKKRTVKILSIILAVMLTCTTLLSCTPDTPDGDAGGIILQKDLMQGFSAQVIAERLPDETYYSMLRMIASASVLKTLSGKSNSAITPLTSLRGISLAANGLSDKTQNEILHVLGDLKIAALNEYNATYAHILKKDTGAEVFSSFRLGMGKSCFVPDNEYLQMNANYYGAEGYILSFAQSDVNALVKEWINSKIGINDVAFDGRCTDTTASLIVDAFSLTGSFETGFSGKESAVFYTPDKEKEVSFLVSGETLFASTSKSTGFAKELENGLTFIALLPKSGETLDTLIQSLDAETLKACYGGITEKNEFGVKIPEFSFSCVTDCAPALKSLGMKSVFEKSAVAENEKTEFTVEKMFDVTAVRLTENGFTTSSALPAAPESTATPTEGVSFSVFDRPFVFIVFDTTGVPLTVGTVVDP